MIKTRASEFDQNGASSSASEDSPSSELHIGPNGAPPHRLEEPPLEVSSPAILAEHNVPVMIDRPTRGVAGYDTVAEELYTSIDVTTLIADLKTQGVEVNFIICFSTFSYLIVCSKSIPPWMQDIISATSSISLP